MTAAEFTSITGISLDSSETTRFEDTLEPIAAKELERLLGYPLDPSSWPNLYIETGKTTSDCLCPDVDTDSLDPADTLPEDHKYRLYDYVPTDRYLHIDPATAIHTVKLVRNGVCFYEFNDEDNEDQYLIKWEGVSGDDPLVRYLDVNNCPCWSKPCWKKMDYVQLAVDADWAFTDVPLELQNIQASMIQGLLSTSDPEILSETRGSHSYTKREAQTAIQKYPQLADFAGPNGLAVRKRFT